MGFNEGAYTFEDGADFAHSLLECTEYGAGDLYLANNKFLEANEKTGGKWANDIGDKWEESYATILNCLKKCNAVANNADIVSEILSQVDAG